MAVAVAVAVGEAEPVGVGEVVGVGVGDALGFRGVGDGSLKLGFGEGVRVRVFRGAGTTKTGRRGRVRSAPVRPVRVGAGSASVGSVVRVGDGDTCSAGGLSFREPPSHSPVTHIAAAVGVPISAVSTTGWGPRRRRWRPGSAGSGEPIGGVSCTRRAGMMSVRPVGSSVT